jgi:hypothetical protein
MSSPVDTGKSAGPRQRHVEMGVAGFMLVLGAIVVVGSLQVRIGWAAEGPQSGFFPFWIGVLICAASAFNLMRAYVGNRIKMFAEWQQIAQVRKIVWPMILFVAAVPWLGIYVSSALLIAGFMRWLGRYGWLLTLGISIGLPILTYVTFENWFLVPLPKGPLEDLLGL